MNKHENKISQNINEQNNMATTIDAETQVALQVTKLLDTHAQQINQDIANQLTNARNLAVNHLAERQSQTVNQLIVNQSGSTLQWSSSNLGQYFGQHRFIMIGLIGIAILFAFFAIQQIDINNLERSDAFLLASDLPPEAYADQGFDAWLDTTTD
jgi:hypothetical protein